MRESGKIPGSFAISWEQRKVSEITSSYSGGTPKAGTTEYYDGDIPFIRSGEIYGDTTELFITEEGLNSSSAKMVHIGDILYALYGATSGEVSCAKLDGAINQAILAIIPNDEVNADFLVEWFRKEKAQITDKYLQGGQGNLSAQIIKDLKVTIPMREEQNKIGEYFSKVNHLITLHQRKLRVLCILERLLYENIKQFEVTVSWEQRKLGDIGKARSGVGFPDAEQGGAIGIPFFKVSDMNLDGNENEMVVANNYVTAEQIAVHRWSPITELPAIFFAKVGAAVMLNRKRLCRFPFLLDNNTMAYSLSSMKWDADFAKALFGTVDLTSLIQVGALPSYNASDVESMEIYLPSILEQEQIGAYFKQLDHLITLHQRKP